VVSTNNYPLFCIDLETRRKVSGGKNVFFHVLFWDPALPALQRQDLTFSNLFMVASYMEEDLKSIEHLWRI
jgi:hypothetical protein